MRESVPRNVRCLPIVTYGYSSFLADQRFRDASFEPGGWLEEPPKSSSPLLDLRIYPRMNIYVEDDKDASFIVDAAFSYTNGFPWTASSDDAGHPETIELQISTSGSEETILAKGTIAAGSKSNEVTFETTHLSSRLEPYNITLTATSGTQTFTQTTQFRLLPDNPIQGASVSKLDNLYGALQTQDYLSNSTEWDALLPYTYYVSWGGWLENSTSNLDTFKAYGYNVLHAVPTFDLDEFEKFFSYCDQIGLWVMYDMRHTYKNLTALTEEVERFKHHPSLLLWYTSDEPDGVGDPLSAPREAYDLLRELDPYHPVSLCLNCYNFHYQEYSQGADILLSDVYPVGINASWSVQFNTVCNTTYGDCGCDDCNGTLADVSRRLDLFAQYQSWLGNEAGPPKSLWTVPQAFGESEYWSRNPTGEEEVVMAMISLNHNSKGIVAWIFPTTEEINDATSELAKALTARDVTSLMLGASTVALQVRTGAGETTVDVASWKKGDKVLVSVVNWGYEDIEGPVSVEMPYSVKNVDKAVWGSTDGWTLPYGGRTLTKESGLAPLEVDVLVLTLA